LSLDKACAVAAAHRSYRLRTIRELLQRQEARPEQRTLLQEHAVIRSLADYAQFVQQAFHAEATS
jgi:hypothetical protein